MSQKQLMPKSEDLSRSLEINAIWTFDTEFPTIFNKSCTYITFKSAVKHRQLGYGYHVSPMHQSCRTKKCGLYLSTQFPFLGASPDAIVSCSCCDTSVVEIKCPYMHRDVTICEALLDKDFCLDNDVNFKATQSLQHANTCTNGGM